MLFGEKLRVLREQSGLSQSDLSVASGIPLWTLRGYEQGRREPLWVVLFTLADALGVPVETFRECLSREGDKHVRKQVRGFVTSAVIKRPKKRKRKPGPPPTYKTVPLTRSRHNTFVSRCRLVCERCAAVVGHVDATFGETGLSGTDAEGKWPDMQEPVARHAARCRPRRSRSHGEISV